MQEALGVLSLSIIMFVMTGPLFAPLGIWGLPGWQALSFAAPALLVLKLRQAPWGAVGLVLPRPSSLLAATLIGCSLWIWSVEWIAPIGQEWGDTEDLEKLSQSLDVEGRDLWVTLFCLALVPAVCEELFHRGVIARSLARVTGPVPAVLVSSMLFAASHLSWARLLPTALLGIVAASLCLATGSLWPSVLLHLLYNTCLLVMAHYQLHLPAELAMIALLLSLLGAGLVILTRSRSEDSKVSIAT